MRPVEEVLGEMSNHASFGWTTRLISLLSQTWAKLNYEVSLRSSLVSPNSSHFRNSLLKMINLQQKFSTHFKRVATNTVVPDQLNPTTTHRSLSTLMLRSNTSAFIMGELNIWSMFGIVVGAVTFLIGFYYVANVSHMSGCTNIPLLISFLLTTVYYSTAR